MSLPQEISIAMQEAIEYLAKTIRYEIQEADTHKVIVVSGWNNSDLTRQAIAKYLVGLRACAIDAALNIRAHLANSRSDRLEILSNVEEIIGSSERPLSPEQIETERNPWMAEGIWHLCLVIAANKTSLHPPGKIIALDRVHIAAKDHGFDLIAIYESQRFFGISIVETKAYLDRPNQAINHAVAFYKEIDNEQHNLRIRQNVENMRVALPKKKQNLISPSFWKQIRSYIPNPHYDAKKSMCWTNCRPSFKELIPDKNHIIVMPHIIKGFTNFFDSIAAEMRKFAMGL
ncbi:MAG: hypothetical protein ILNGONEN_01054 [Syntrophorhabdaceae bacterium]|nr:hypothetical protein [Syntrophorhabdaceae bacterium]